MKLKNWLRVSVAITLSSLALVVSSVAVIRAELIERGTAVDARLQTLSEVERTLDAILEQSRLLSPADMGHRRMDIRIFMINSQLSQAKDPVVIVGDSITEAALFPSQICGHAVVNAGIGGATPANYLQLIQANGLLSGMNSALTVVALGTNNAQTTARLADFDGSYRELLSAISTRSRKIVAVAVPPISDGNLTQYFEPSRVPELNSIIHKAADDLDIKTVTFTRPIATIDGVHLGPVGYKDWIGSVVSASRTAIGCAPTAQAD